MKICGYCGKEYPDETAVCAVDGEPLRSMDAVPVGVFASSASAPPARPPHLQFKYLGKLLLRRHNASSKTGYSTVASVDGGIFAAELSVGSETLKVQRHLTVAGGLMLGMLIFLVTFFVVALGQIVLLALVKSKPDAGQTMLLSASASVLGTVGLLALLAWQARRRRRQIAFGEISQVQIVSGAAEIHLRRPADGTAPPAGEVQGQSYAVADEFVFTPRGQKELQRLAMVLVHSGVHVINVDESERSDFRRRLMTATPRAWATPALIGLNVLVFVLMCLWNIKSATRPSNATLVDWGADFRPATISGEWWRLLTSCFVHVGWQHLIGNMIALLWIGHLAERLFGNWMYLGLYLACGLVASLSSLLFNPDIPCAGASGAIMGMYGALLGFLAREREELPRIILVPLARSALVFVGFILYFSLVDTADHSAKGNGMRTDHAAHVGGVVSGLILGFLAARPLDITKRRAASFRAVTVLALGTAVMAAALGFAATSFRIPETSGLFNVGLSYLHGEGVARNPDKALKWIRKAAELGDVGAQATIGLLYLRGDGVPQDTKQSFHWYQMAAEQGHTNAERVLATMYYHGDGVEKNFPEAAKWFTKASELGDATSQHSLGLMYYNGEGVPRNYTNAFQWYKRAADQGDTNAERMVGLMYYNGQGVAKDFAESAKWTRKLAELGDASSESRLGWMCEHGTGVPKDFAEALAWYRRAADQDNAFSMAQLGLMCENGEGTPKDLAAAFKWYTKAAEKGVAAAQCNLARCYRRGWGAEADPAAALHWFHRAAEQGDLVSQMAVGEIYFKGLGVAKDSAEAYQWYSKAAQQGSYVAQAMLGFMCCSGDGVPKDRVEAYKWLTLAETGGHTEAAAKLLDLLAKEMTPDELTGAKQRAENFVAQKSSEPAPE